MKIRFLPLVLRCAIYLGVFFALITIYSTWLTESLGHRGHGLSLDMLLFVLVEGPALRLNVLLAKDPTQLPLKFDAMMRLAIGVNFLLGTLIGGCAGSMVWFATILAPKLKR